MMRDGEGNILPCEIKAGGKHQDSVELRKAMNDWLRDYTRTHGWEVKDNNAIAAKRRRSGTKTERVSPPCIGLCGVPVPQHQRIDAPSPRLRHHPKAEGKHGQRPAAGRPQGGTAADTGAGMGGHRAPDGTAAGARTAGGAAVVGVCALRPPPVVRDPARGIRPFSRCTGQLADTGFVSVVGRRAEAAGGTCLSAACCYKSTAPPAL